MSEYAIVWTAFGAFIGLGVGCLFYSLGGRKGKWLRRFVGSFIIASTLWICSVVMHNFYWWFLLAYPLLAIGFSFGYGADVFWEKVFKRTCFALMVMSAGLVCAIVVGGNAWMVFIYQVGVGLWSIFLGVKNPISAPAEEAFVCASLNLGLIAYPFVTG